MVLRTCERCGQVEVAPEDEAPHAIEHGGEKFAVCTRCYVEFCDWFYDAEPDHLTHGLETSRS